jgi:hypothetical protein
MTKIMAIKGRVDESDKRRDFFPAFLASCVLAVNGGKTSVTEILSTYYPTPKSVTVTPEEWDLDDGAKCNEAQIKTFFGFR